MVGSDGEPLAQRVLLVEGQGSLVPLRVLRMREVARGLRGTGHHGKLVPLHAVRIWTLEMSKLSCQGK